MGSIPGDFVELVVATDGSIPAEQLAQLKLRPGTHLLARRASPDDKVYGLKSYRAWDKSHPPNLSGDRSTPDQVAKEEATPVTSFRELARIVAFLSVMNKTRQLLYRGQSGPDDREPLPTLMRSSWTSSLTKPGTKVSLEGDLREYYWTQLREACTRVVGILQTSNRLPRWKPFELSKAPEQHPALRMAPWAVVQHYELWPTPVLDLTGSLRIAASFALDMTRRRHDSGVGYVLVFGFQPHEIVSDIMDMDRGRAESGLGRVDDAGSLRIIRLSAVCPPDTPRPHLQDGYLAGWPQFDASGFSQGAVLNNSLKRRLVAKFRVHDRLGDLGPSARFWDRDFPRHSRRSLLPDADNDEFVKALHSQFRYELTGDRLTLV